MLDLFGSDLEACVWIFVKFNPLFQKNLTLHIPLISSNREWIKSDQQSHF